ncbi:hypothetical protein [Demequina sp. NBRC 110051]|uniref:hypothetical protein n=1 Tax=Demequina sp. NBRC 110051 TaxID=1570340 RepID=UPI0009FCA648|nr:hypothetical protein [Demequina sp. NBRC 110051]
MTSTPTPNYDSYTATTPFSTHSASERAARRERVRKGQEQGISAALARARQKGPRGFASAAAAQRWRARIGGAR